MMGALVFWVLAAVTVGGAALVVLSREVMRFAAGLGAFLLGVAGLYLYLASPFLAVAQLFLYVGGVLVLLLFALMLLRRQGDGSLELPVRHDLSAAVVAAAVGVAIGIGYAPLAAGAGPSATAPEAVAAVLLGPYLPIFEALGVLLLAGLVAALTIVGPAAAGRYGRPAAPEKGEER
jgi:NADH-quinone oxidoreductase subunit J